MSHLFISYRTLERRFALKLGAALRNAGVSVWVDTLADAIRGGDDWPRAIEDAIDRCRALIAIVSPDYVNSTVCRRELARADQVGRPIIPLLISPIEVNEWPLEIQRLQYIDFTGWLNDTDFHAGVQRLIDLVHSDATDTIGPLSMLHCNRRILQSNDVENRNAGNLAARLKNVRFSEMRRPCVMAALVRAHCCPKTVS